MKSKDLPIDVIVPVYPKVNKIHQPRLLSLSTTTMLGTLLLFAASVSAQLTPSQTYTPPSASQGTVSSTSAPNPQWAAVLGNSLYFYDAQRSGNLSQGTYGNRVPWRNDSCLDDGKAEGMDLSGGWFDAGDVSGLDRRAWSSDR